MIATRTCEEQNKLVVVDVLTGHLASGEGPGRKLRSVLATVKGRAGRGWRSGARLAEQRLSVSVGEEGASRGPKGWWRPRLQKPQMQQGLSVSPEQPHPVVGGTGERQPVGEVLVGGANPT